MGTRELVEKFQVGNTQVTILLQNKEVKNLYQKQKGNFLKPMDMQWTKSSHLHLVL